MKKIIILIIIVLVLCSPLYSGEIKSVTVETVKINWQIDGDNLIMELTAPTEGWISIGFNPSSKMKDANIIIGCVDGSGSPIMEDHFGTSPISHKSDSDYEKVEFHYNFNFNTKLIFPIMPVQELHLSNP